MRVPISRAFFGTFRFVFWIPMMLAYAVAPYIFAGAEPREPSARAASPKGNSPGPAARTMPDADEARLIERVRAGDPNAMREAVLTYADPLTRFAATLTRSRDTAESIAYDVLAAAWHHRDRLRPDQSLKGYLFVAVRRRALNEIAREQTRDKHAARMTREAKADPESWATPDADTLIAIRDDADDEQARMDALRRVINTLPDRRRLALHLRFEQGLSYPAMGEILGLSDKAAQQLVLRTLTTLRRLLNV